MAPVLDYYMTVMREVYKRPIESQSEIRVVNSGWVEIQYVGDYPDGSLGIAEAGKNIPFEIKRVYFINNFGETEAVRGKHAHRKLRQVIFCISGTFDLELDDGEKRQTIKMDCPYRGVILGQMLWHTMANFSKDCTILVLADDLYDESDYIRNYNDFMELVRLERKNG